MNKSANLLQQVSRYPARIHHPCNPWRWPEYLAETRSSFV